MINYHGQNRRMEINELCGKARTCAFEEKNNALHTKEAKKRGIDQIFWTNSSNFPMV